MSNQSEVFASLDEIRNELQSVFTQEFIYQLSLYCKSRLYKQFGVKYDLQKGISGLLIEDIIQTTNLAFLAGKRNWNKTKYSSLKEQYISAFDSILCNEIEKKESHEVSRNSITEPLAFFNISEPESEDNEKNQEYLNIFKSYCDDQEELFVFEAYYIDDIKRGEIARLLEKSPNDVTKILKRVVRKLLSIKEKFKFERNDTANN